MRGIVDKIFGILSLSIFILVFFNLVSNIHNNLFFLTIDKIRRESILLVNYPIVFSQYYFYFSEYLNISKYNKSVIIKSIYPVTFIPSPYYSFLEYYSLYRFNYIFNSSIDLIIPEKINGRSYIIYIFLK